MVIQLVVRTKSRECNFMQQNEHHKLSEINNGVQVWMSNIEAITKRSQDHEGKLVSLDNR